VNLTYPEELELEKNKLILSKILGKNQVHIDVQKFSLIEDFDSNLSYISCDLKFVFKGKEKTINIEGTGKGTIDALLNGMLAYFSTDYVSLQMIQLCDFLVNVDFKKSRNMINTDAPVEVKIALKGDGLAKFYFKARSNSLVKAGIKAVCDAIEYLINAEIAVLQLREDILLAKKRQRTDLENNYVCMLLELVKFIPYSEAIKKKRN